MFLSLKGALGRNPMINRVGQRLLQAFEGASAAYSLRDLASNIASVVRVRRASDNSEKDFSAADVSSGAMTQWVNGQVVPPLDVRELVDGERTGALIPAAAAYSLRNLSTSYTGNVVDVRRSSDNAEESFTAAQVADGTLTDWVNGNWENVNYSTFTNGESWEDGFTAINTTSSGAGLKIPSGTTGDVITISFNLTLNSGTPSPSVTLRNSAGGSVFSNVEVVSTAGSHSLTLTATGSYGYITIGEGDVPSGFSISNVILNVVPNPIFDGFVTQWYDQSGNANHATQGTDASQPKIVSGGTLVSGGLDFDGVNDGLAVSGQVLTSSSLYAASVMQHATGVSTPSGQNVFGQYQVNTSGRFQLSANNSSVYSFFANATDHIVGFGTGAIGTSQTLVSVNGDGSNAEIWRDGTSKATDTYSGFTPATVNFTIGIDAAGDREFNGKIAEVIIYNSDQSDNRTAIEANIGDTYNIDLPSGVDTGYDQVDGFVETWYDQSGNGNDAVQQVSGKQPKIVDAGSLVKDSDNNTSVKFESSAEQHLTNTSLPSSFTSSNATFSDFTVQEAFQNNVTTTAWGFGSTGSSTLRLIKLLHSSGNFGYQGYGSTFSYISAFDTAPYSANEVFLASGVRVGTDLDIFKNSADADMDNSFDTGTIALNTFAIGSYVRSTGNINHFNGNIAEIIIYDTDQSANRAAIEANINNQYDIY